MYAFNIIGVSRLTTDELARNLEIAIHPLHIARPVSQEDIAAARQWSSRVQVTLALMASVPTHPDRYGLYATVPCRIPDDPTSRSITGLTP